MRKQDWINTSKWTLSFSGIDKYSEGPDISDFQLLLSPKIYKRPFYNNAFLIESFGSKEKDHTALENLANLGRRLMWQKEKPAKEDSVENLKSTDKRNLLHASSDIFLEL